MSDDIQAKNIFNEDVSLTAYIWPTMRSSVLISWMVLQIISIVTYILFISWLKIDALNSHLATSNTVISEAIDVGDWDFALNALRANANVGDVFRLTLGTLDNKTIYAGPFGATPFGFGVYCGENRAATKIVGCIRIFALADFFNLIAFITISILFSFFSFFILRRRFLGILDQVADSLADGLKGNPSGIKEIKAVQKRILGLMKEREISSNQKALAELSAQVAHDIRSPLGALKILASRFPHSETGYNKMVHSVIQRIEDIASKLLDKHRAAEPRSRLAVNIWPLIENIISEKQISFSEQKVCITLQQPHPTTELFVFIDPKEFSAIISNLVNNSVESFGEGSGNIQVNVKREANNCIIRISDDGAGIPEELINRVGRKGFRSSKVGGSGLGLLHARTKLEEWGGSLAIQSTVELGTVIELILRIDQGAGPLPMVGLASDLLQNYTDFGTRYD